MNTSDQIDPDSTPGNGISSEDDLDDATITEVPIRRTPDTGSNSGPLLRAGWVMLLSGALLALLARRRRRDIHLAN